MRIMAPSNAGKKVSFFLSLQLRILTTSKLYHSYIFHSSLQIIRIDVKGNRNCQKVSFICRASGGRCSLSTAGNMAQTLSCVQVNGETPGLATSACGLTR